MTDWFINFEILNHFLNWIFGDHYVLFHCGFLVVPLWQWTPSELLKPVWPRASKTRGSWRINHHDVNHIRCLFRFLLLFTSTACVPHFIGTKVGQTRGNDDRSGDTLEEVVSVQTKRLSSCPRLCEDKTNGKRGILHGTLYLRSVNNFNDTNWL